MTEKKPYRFVIGCGGTGGHIYPAISVAREIKSRYPDADILFVGAKGRMEMSKVPEAGFKIIGLWISGFQRRVSIDNLYFPFKVLHSYWAARNIVKRIKPDAVLGFGGYASAPIMMGAQRKKVPTLLQEQNSYAGLTNKQMSKKAQTICVAYKGMEKYFGTKEKIVLTGNPVRKDIVNVADKREKALEHFNLSAERKTILVLGGSLGARTINNSVIAHLESIIHAGVQLIWQTGKFYYDDMNTRSKNFDLSNIRVMQFIKEMDLAYSAADVVISRAGALSISELCIVGKPTILVPSPNVSEDHQTKNATALTSEDAAIMIKDFQAEENLVEKALKLLNDESQCEKLATNIKKLAKPKATEEIVEELMKIVSWI